MDLTNFIPNFLKSPPEKKVVSKNSPNKRKTVSDKVSEEAPLPTNRNVILPGGGRVSDPNTGSSGSIMGTIDKFNKVLPPYNPAVIPVIRKLYRHNPDFGLVVWDHIQLTNTGHKIKFDLTVPPEQQDKMRKHLSTRVKTWGDGTFGINGIINKLIGQIWIGGAISGEWVINNDLSGINTVALINPEEIEWHLVGGRYAPYQKRRGFSGKKTGPIRLNPLTYQYIGIVTDEEIPYGIPPLLTALKEAMRAISIDGNIDNVLDLLGVLGFLEAKLEKPDQLGGENDGVYEKRLEKLLVETKDNVLKGLRTGVTVGFKEDHEFDFHSTTKDLNGVGDIYTIIWKKLSNGLKTHPAFLAIEGNHSDSSMSIVFTKMLSQLKNIHMALSHFLEYGYKMELILAGYDPKGLKVEFNPSTITDELKYQQAQEIKVRNLQALYDQGIIGQDTFAEESGYEHADQKEPRVKRDKNVLEEAKDKQDREKSKDKSDRKVREKNTPNPKRKDQKTK